MLRVLTYHRVAEADETPQLDPRLISASPTVFERQMRHLARHYCVIRAEELLSRIDSDRPIPARAVLITFDDAYRDFATNALPILERYSLPATLFVPTAYPDRPDRAFWWDRLHRAVHAARVDRLETSFAGDLSLTTEDERGAGLRELQRRVKRMPHAAAMARVDELCAQLGGGESVDNAVLSWNALRRLAERGVTLAPHTRTHPLLDRVNPEQARDEIHGSRSDLTRETGAELPIFSYPDGAHDKTVRSIAREAGFSLAFSTRDGLNDLAPDGRLQLRRTNITRRTGATIFRLRMLPPFARVDSWRHRSAEARA